MAYDEILSRLSLDSDATLAVYTGVSGMPGAGVAVQVPVAPVVTTGGTAGSTTYSYRVSAVGQAGETLASAATAITTGNATLSATDYNSVAFTTVDGAVSYNVYGRTAGTEKLIGNAITSPFKDDGTVTPGALPPVSDGSRTTVGLQYRFVEVSTAADHTATLAGVASTKAVGVMQNKPQHVGEAATIGRTGVSLVVAGASGLTHGDLVQTDKYGRGVSGATGSNVLGVVVVSAPLGALASVLLQTN